MSSSVSHGFELPSSAASRPVIRGRHLVVACGHYLAAVAGLRMRERGGNAIDAGVAMVFAQTVLETQSAGFGGECPILIYPAAERDVVAINGNTRAPAAATIDWFRHRGVTLIPRDGFLAAGVCATPDALITALKRFGRLSLAEVLAPAIELAGAGFPVYEGMRTRLQAAADRLWREWPTSAALYLRDGHVPDLGETWRNPDLARTFERLVEAERTARHLGRDGALRAARDRFYRGDIVREIVAFQRETTVRDVNGMESPGLLTEEDFATFETRVERPVTASYRGLDVYKCGPWSQGPVFLQQLNLLEGFELPRLGHTSADHIHVLVEAAKLAFADRERYYGDPEFTDVPLRGLLSKTYAAARRELIDLQRASLEMRPGDPHPFEGGEPARSVTIRGRMGDAGTTGTRAVDEEGNMFSATPSGGWFYDSPVIAGLGFCLGTRCQTFWLDPPDHPNALRPRKRPRTTLTPSLVMRGGQPYMVFGTPGVDNQDQWTLQFFLNVVDFGMDLQDAIDAPAFHSAHFPTSFYPKQPTPGQLVLEGTVPPPVREELERRGHVVTVFPPWTLNFTTAVAIDLGRGVLEGAASSRGERNYALGW